MGEIEVRLFTSGEAELRSLARSLQNAGRGELQARLRRNLREAGQPVISELRSAVMDVTVSSTKGGAGRPSYSRDLRVKVARAIRLSVAYRGVRFNVQTQAIGIPKYGAALAKYLDGELPMYRNWRHPVFGKDVWTVQHGQPWFFVTIRANASRFEDACVDAVNEIIREIG